MAGIEQTKTYGVSYTLTADGRSLNEALTTAVTAAKDLSASLTDAHAKMQTLMSGKGVTDVVNNFSKFYKDQLDKQKKGVSNILDEQAKRLQNINAKINVIGNFTGKVEALNSVARSLTRIKTLYDKTGGAVSFNINVQIGKSQTQLESLRRKAESVRTAIQKPIKIDVQTGAGRTQLGQAVKNLKSWTAELKSMGSALASQAGDKAIPVNVKPQVSPNTPPLQTSAMVTEIMNNLKTSAGTVGVEGIVNFVKAAEAVAGEIGGLSGIISFVKAAKTVVGEVGGLSGIIESVKGAKSVIGEVGGLSGIISNVKAAQSVVGEISGLTGTITSVQNAAEKILSINVEGIVNSVKTGTKTEALPLEAKLDTANINEQIKAFKPNPIAVKVQLGWGTKEDSQASQIKKMSESLKPLPMSVDLDISKAKAKLEELRTFAASMSPLNVGTTMTGPANKGTTQSAVQSQVQRATVASIRATSGSRSRITYDDQTGWPTRRGGFYTDLRKNLYPFTGNTSFGARTPMALDMAKGMGMMFAVSGVMQAVTGSFNQVAEYENLMKTVQAILKTNDGGGDFSGRFKAMENEIRRVGRTTKFTAPEVAGAARFMAMAGLGIEDINAATNPIANLALVGDNDMSTTADKMTNIMTSFGLLKGLSASQKKANMNHTSDVLTNTFSRSNTDLIQLAEAMQYAGPMSHLTGTSLEDAAAMVGIMGNAGIQSSMAGTTLRMMYQNIIKPNKKQAAEWDRLGIKRTDAQGRVRNIFDILQELRAKITGTTDLNAKIGSDQLKIMGAEVMSLFRTTAGAGTAALLENLGEAISLAQSNRAANGVAQTIADQKKNTISGLWAQVTSTFTDQSVDTVTEFQETIKNMLKDMRDWLASKEAADTLKNIYSMAKEVLDVLGWVAGVWKDIYSFAPDVINTFIKFQFIATQIGFLVTPFVQVAGAISTLTSILFGFGKALGFSASAATVATAATRTAATTGAVSSAVAGLPYIASSVVHGTAAGGGVSSMLGLPYYASKENYRNFVYGKSLPLSRYTSPMMPISWAKPTLGLPYYPNITYPLALPYHAPVYDYNRAFKGRQSQFKVGSQYLLPQYGAPQSRVGLPRPTLALPYYPANVAAATPFMSRIFGGASSTINGIKGAVGRGTSGLMNFGQKVIGAGANGFSRMRGFVNNTIAKAPWFGRNLMANIALYGLAAKDSIMSKLGISSANTNSVLSSGIGKMAVGSAAKPMLALPYYPSKEDYGKAVWGRNSKLPQLISPKTAKAWVKPTLTLRSMPLIYDYNGVFGRSQNQFKIGSQYLLPKYGKPQSMAGLPRTMLTLPYYPNGVNAAGSGFAGFRNRMFMAGSAGIARITSGISNISKSALSSITSIGSGIATSAMTRAAGAMNAASRAMGTASSMWGRMTRTLATSMPFLATMGGKMKGMAMGAGTAVSGMFNRFSNGVNTASSKAGGFFNGFIPIMSRGTGNTATAATSHAAAVKARYNSIYGMGKVSRAFNAGMTMTSMASFSALFASIRGTFFSVLSFFAKGIGMLLSPVGLAVTAIGGLTYAIYKWHDSMEKTQQQIGAMNEVTQKWSNSILSLDNAVLSNEAERGKTPVAIIAYNNESSNPSKTYSLSGNKEADSILNSDHLLGSQILSPILKSQVGKYLPQAILNSIVRQSDYEASSTSGYSMAGGVNKDKVAQARKLAMIAAWQQVALSDEATQEAKNAISLAQEAGDYGKVKSILEAFSPKGITKTMWSLKDDQQIHDLDNPQMYREFREAQYLWLQTFAESKRPIQYFKDAMEQLEKYKDLKKLGEGESFSLVQKILQGATISGKNNSIGGVVLNNKGYIDWGAMAEKFNGGKKNPFNEYEKGSIIGNIYESLKTNEELQKSPDIYELLRTFLPKIAGLPGFYVRPGDEVKMGDRINKEDWKEAAKDWFENSGEYKGNKSFDKFFKDGVWMQKTPINTISKYYLKRQEEANKVNDKNGIIPPSTDQSAYDSKYNRHQARPTQIIFNIDQLCKFENTQVNSADQKSIAETVGRQLSEGLQILFAQAASDFAIVGEANG